ncbi:MAG TPA: DMT family transporter [Steroidobacteraceae bacterium]|nr:DMT family transporter [Steroidobacteraceae bacterium]
MPLLALLAVLVAAVVHAVWNVIAKRAVGSRHFVWLYSVASMVIWAPLVGYVLATLGPPRQPVQWLALGATGILHLGYAMALQAGYRAADLSIVYPIARGFGPLLSFIGAVLFLGDRYTAASVLGLVLIVSGMALVSGLVGRARRIERHGVGWGLLTGSCIAGYTLNDGWAVQVLLVSPLVVDYFGNLVRFAALLPAALRDRERVLAEARQYRWSAVGVGALAPLAYILVLFAMRLAPVSHVAPARELATLVGTYLGARLLREAVTLPRLVGAACIVGGIVSLALARY